MPGFLYHSSRCCNFATTIRRASTISALFTDRTPSLKLEYSVGNIDFLQVCFINHCRNVLKNYFVFYRRWRYHPTDPNIDRQIQLCLICDLLHKHVLRCRLIIFCIHYEMFFMMKCYLTVLSLLTYIHHVKYVTR